jgi:uncharacterized protein (DUF305 family)
VDSARTRQKLAAAGLIAVIVMLVGGSILYSALREETPDDSSAEAGFLRDMQVHHNQAVVMADIIRFRTEDDQIMAMSTDIAFAQMSQIGTMSGFLQLWDLSPTGDEPAMAWMGHPAEGRMPGMASPEEIEQLRELPVAEAEVLFLQLMNRHHIAGVEMAQALIDRSDQEETVQMAEGMIRTQTAEIEVMNKFLSERGEEPVTSYDADLPAGNTVAPSPEADHGDHD